MKKILLTAAALFISIPLLADSPLTSTDIYKAYEDVPVIQDTVYDSVITYAQMEYLSSADQVEYKIALINKLGWNFNGKNNAGIYRSFLQGKYGTGNNKALYAKMKADELLSLAYLKALDNYFNVKEAVLIAESGLRKRPESYTFHLITALIRAQDAMEDDWNEVYRLTDSVRRNRGLRKDMRPEAVKIIFNYMDEYKQ